MINGKKFAIALALSAGLTAAAGFASTSASAALPGTDPTALDDTTSGGPGIPLGVNLSDTMGEGASEVVDSAPVSSGMDAETEVIEFKEGNDDVQRKRPGTVTHQLSLGALDSDGDPVLEPVLSVRIEIPSTSIE
jgi:hypothetical protein